MFGPMNRRLSGPPYEHPYLVQQGHMPTFPRMRVARWQMICVLALALATHGCRSYMDYCASNAACYKQFWDTVLPGSCQGDCRPPAEPSALPGPAIEPTCIAGYELVRTGIMRCEPVKP